MSNPIKTGWLKDKEGNKFAPKTLTSQVQTSDGVLLEDYVNTETGKLSEAIAELNDELAALPQSDWNQNDETAVDFIKNRTHYEIPDVWEQVEFTEPVIKNVSTTMFVSDTYTWDADKTYHVRVDGVEYVFDGMKKSGVMNAFGGKVVYSIGAPYAALNSNINWAEYPFSFATADFTNIYAVFEDSTTDHTVELFISNGEIKQLDQKFVPNADWSVNDENEAGYIKNRTHYEEVVTDDIDITGLEYDILFEHNGTTLVLTEHNKNIPFALGQVWSCSVDSWTSELTVEEADDGTLYVSSISGGYPSPSTYYITPNTAAIAPSFGSHFGTSAVLTGVSGTYVATETQVHRLDEKYIPDTIMRTPSEDDALELVAELGLAEPMTDDEGNVLTDENGVLFIL